MRFTLMLLATILNGSLLLGQTNTGDRNFAFKITGYIKSVNDSVTIVQVIKPAAIPVTISDKQLGVMYHCFSPGTQLDTAMIGWGRCNLIKGDYYYFGIRLQKKQQVFEGDLIYIRGKIPAVYNGLLLPVSANAIQFTNVYGNNFYDDYAVFTHTQKAETALLDSMVSDIQFTGTEMKKQMPEQNKQIKGGRFDGAKLFDAMQAVKRSDLELFLKYVIARPKKYAGNSWKISETFATWMDNGTPTVIED